MDDETTGGAPLTLKGDIPTKHAIKGYEQTNVIKKGILNNNRVRVAVSDITLLKANILVQYTSQIVILRVRTEIVQLSEVYDVKRSMEDFHVFRKVLIKRYPYVLIPPLPTSYRLTKVHFLTMEKRVQRFLARLMQSELLKSDPDLYLFLTKADQVSTYLNERLREKLPDLGLFNVYTEEGRARV